MKKIIYNYRFSNEVAEVADLFIDGAIVDAETQQFFKDFFNDDSLVSFKSIRNQIESAKPKTLNVIINSPGGQVFEAMAIHDYFEDLKAKGVVVNTKGIGLVASAATYPLMSGTKTTMTENSHLMIHNVSGGVSGDVNEVEKYTNTLRKLNNSIRDYYAQKTGMKADDIATMMNAETFMTAQEAKDKGFIDEIAPTQKFSNYIDPKNWPFKNMAVLNLYNSFTEQSNDSSMANKIMDKLTEGFANILKAMNPKNEANGNKPFTNEELSTIINKGFEGLNIDELINNAVEARMKAPETATIINTAVTTATKDFATNAAVKKVSDDLVQLTTDIANKVATPGKLTTKKEGDKENKFDRDDIGWGE